MTRRVEAIPGLPLPNGLLNAATIIEVTDPHELLGVSWPVLGCTEAHTWDWCPPDDESPGDISPGESPGESPGDVSPGDGSKTFERAAWDDAEPITIYAGAECDPFSLPYAEAVERARTSLVMGEQRALEEWLMVHVLANKAVDITPESGPVAIPQSVGLLEGWLARNYGGLGVLHVPADLSAMLAQANQMLREGARIRSWLGNWLALGGGYAANVGPGGQVAPAGHAWLYASGPVVVRREVIDIVPDSPGAALNIRTNDNQVLAERTFVVQVACAAAILVNISCCC